MACLLPAQAGTGKGKPINPRADFKRGN